jgi:delta 1-pyrroline-5-carboxylate dehydrogenase
MTCSSGSGLIEISPVKGRSCASISKIDAATPVAKIPIAIIEASRLSLWTMAIATRAQTACINRQAHLSRLTCDSLMMMRCRRASNAVSRAVAMSRCAVFWPSLLGFRARVACSASASTPGNGPKVGRTLSHHRPFLGYYVCNIAADQLTKLNLEVSRKASGENRSAS